MADTTRLLESSFVDAVVAIGQATDLSEQSRRHWVCSLRQIAKWLDRPAELGGEDVERVRGCYRRVAGAAPYRAADQGQGGPGVGGVPRQRFTLVVPSLWRWRAWHVGASAPALVTISRISVPQVGLTRDTDSAPEGSHMKRLKP